MIWVLVLLGLFSVCNCLEPIPPCNLEESTCFTTLARVVYKSAITATGVPDLGIASADPIKLDLVEAASPNLTFTLRNSVADGYEDCVIENAIPMKTANDLTVRLELVCPLLNMSGEYEIDGKLAHLPIQGKGDYTIEAFDYHIEINGKVKYIDRNSEKYMSIDDISYKADIRGPLNLEMDNLFDGNKKLAEPINKFTKENPVVTAQILDRPVFDHIIKIIMDNVNKQLQAIPVTKFKA